MRYIAIQVLTWGTIAGAIGSAFLLAAVDRSAEGYIGAVALDPSLIVPSAPTTQAARKRTDSDRHASPSRTAAASAPHADDR
jgi:hypothetical protein